MPETPAQRELREKDERAWATTIAGRYDLEALLLFLKLTVAERKNWRGVDLTKPRISSKWIIRGRGMSSGDWSFYAHEPENSSFTFAFLDGGHWISLKCVRDGKKSFRLIDITREKVELLLF